VIPVHLNRHALRAIRERSGLSVTALAARAGVSQPHLSNLETGRRKASPAVVHRLATALAVPIVALIDDPELAADPPPGGSAGHRTTLGTTLGPGIELDDSTASEMILADPSPLAGLPRAGSAHLLHRPPVPAPRPRGEPTAKEATMTDPQHPSTRPAPAVQVTDPSAPSALVGRTRRASVAAAGLISAAAVLGSAVPAQANTYYSGNCTTSELGLHRSFQSRGIVSLDSGTGRWIWNWYDYKYTVDPGLSFGGSSDEVVTFQTGYISGLSNPWASPDSHGTSGDWIQEANWKGIWSERGSTRIKFHAAFDVPGTPDPHCDVYVGTV
jgi:transcriptional regulator with XRE-family HTH domain